MSEERWIVKSHNHYLQTLWWMLDGPQQSLAIRFESRARAASMARRWKLCDADSAPRVVKLRERVSTSASPKDSEKAE